MEKEPHLDPTDIIPDFSVKVDNSYARIIDPGYILSVENNQVRTILSEEFFGEPVSSATIATKKSPRDEAQTYFASIKLNPLVHDKFDGKYRVLDRICSNNQHNFLDVDGLCFERIPHADSVLVTSITGAEFIIQHIDSTDSDQIIISNKHWLMNDEGEVIYNVVPTAGEENNEKILLEDFIKTYMFVMSATPEGAYINKQNDKFPPERYVIVPNLNNPDHTTEGHEECKNLVFDPATLGNYLRSVLERHSGLFDPGENISTLPGISDYIRSTLITLLNKYHMGETETDSKPRGIVLAGLDHGRNKLISEAFANSLDATFMSVEGKDLFDRTPSRTFQKVDELLDEVLEQEGKTVLFINNLSDVYSKVRNKKKLLETLGSGFEQTASSKSDLVIFASVNDIKNFPREMLGYQRFNWQLDIPLPSGKERRDILAAHVASLMMNDAIKSQPEFFCLTPRYNFSKLALQSSGLGDSELKEAIERAREKKFQTYRKYRRTEKSNHLSTNDIELEIKNLK